MEPIVVIAFVLVTIVLLKFIFKIDFNESKQLKEDKELEKLTDKLPENVEIAKEMLQMLGNEKVKIEESKNSETSLYIAATNKILIADMKNNYARIQTIAHECLHSVQDRRLLMFNFIFSNIMIIYWLIASILTIANILKNTTITIFILLLMAIIKLAVRGVLELDAIIKAKFLSEKYIKAKKILTEEETERILKKYDKINKIAVPFTIVYILLGSLIGILTYSIFIYI